MNVPSSSKPEEFKLKDIEVLVDAKEQPWFKRANVGNVLGTRRISTSDAKLDQDDKHHVLQYKLNQSIILWCLGLDLKINKTAWITSYHLQVLSMTLCTLKKIKVIHCQEHSDTLV